LLSLFNYAFAQEDEKEKTLSRFIWKLKIVNGNDIFVWIDEDLFRKTELKQTLIKPEILKNIWIKSLYSARKIA